MVRFSFAMLWYCLSSSVLHAAIIQVPGDQPSIQSGIDVALSGDTVLVADGVYTGEGNLDISTDGKALVIKSANGPDQTSIVYQRFIDTLPYTRCFFFGSGEDSTTILDGFTITDSGGYNSDEGLGLLVLGSSPIIRNSIVIGFRSGSPVVCDSAAPRFEHCRFEANEGGCSACKESEDLKLVPWLGRAAAVRCINGADASFLNCDFVDNIADVAQGALLCGNSSPTLTDCRFIGNRGYYAHAAAVVCGDSSEPSFMRCEFVGNANDGINRQVFAGAIYLHRSSASFDSCLFDSNAALYTYDREHGVAICADTGSTALITNCTITRNATDGASGSAAVCGCQGAVVNIVASILAFNTDRPPAHAAESTASIQLSCSNVFGNEAGDWIGVLEPQLGVNGNISAEPYFCDQRNLLHGVMDISPCAPENNSCSTLMGAFGIGCFDRMPTITSPAAVGIMENQPFRYLPTFLDSDGPDTLLNYNSVPSWCILIGDTLEGTAPEGTPDTFFVLVVSDGFKADTLVVSVDILTPNVPPNLGTIPPQTVDEGHLLNLVVNATDLNGDSIVIAADSLPEGAAFVDSGNGLGVLAWSPTFSQAGSYYVIFVATDDSLAVDSQRIVITVRQVNLAPSLDSVGSLFLFEGELLELEVAATDFDGDSIYLSAFGLPSNASFIDSGDGRGSLSFQPDSSQSGVYRPIIIATDSALADSLPLIITVLDSVPALANLVIVNQTDLFHITDHQPLFAWSYTDSNQTLLQTQFEIEAGIDSDWIQAETWDPAVFELTDTLVAYDGALLSDGAVYYVRLRVHNSAAWSEWTEVTLRVNSVPSVPIPLAPIADNYAVQQPLLWVTNTSDNENDSVTYNFLIVSDSTYGIPDSLLVPGIAQTADSTAVQVPVPLEENTRYLWRVRAFDGYEYSAWSDPEGTSFWVNATPEPPGTFFTVGPMSGSCASTDLLPTFIWGSSLDPDPMDLVLYRLHLATDSGFVAVVSSQPLEDTVYTPADSLAFGTSYWWKTSAEDNTGQITESSVRRFWTWALGDIDNNHAANVADLTLLISHLFRGGEIPCSLATADINGDCGVNVADLTFMVNFLFKGGPSPRVGCAG